MAMPTTPTETLNMIAVPNWKPPGRIASSATPTNSDPIA